MDTNTNSCVQTCILIFSRERCFFLFQCFIILYIGVMFPQWYVTQPWILLNSLDWQCQPLLFHFYYHPLNICWKFGCWIVQYSRGIQMMHQTLSQKQQVLDTWPRFLMFLHPSRILIFMFNLAFIDAAYSSICGSSSDLFSSVLSSGCLQSFLCTAEKHYVYKAWIGYGHVLKTYWDHLWSRG